MGRSPEIRRPIGVLWRYGRPYRAVMGAGLGAALAVVALRLLMPWPLRGVIELVFPSHGREPLLSGWLPGAGDPLLWFAGAYLVLALATGLAEMAQRVWMKQYAVAVVHDMRADAVRSATRGGGLEASSGDLLARIIGDSARIKEGLSGILVHLSQNGLLFVGVSLVFLVMYPILGVVFMAGGLASMWVGFVTVPPVASVARAQRRSEGRYAERLRMALEGDAGEPGEDAENRTSALSDVHTTRLITRSSLAVHGIFGLTVGVGLLVGATAVRGGSLAPGALFLFIAYALTVHRRIVQVGRQIARSGKVFACAQRLAAVVGSEGERRDGEVRPPLAPLRARLSVEGLGLGVAGEGGAAPNQAFAVQAGSRVAVLSRFPPHATRLLRALSGHDPSARTSWDGAALDAKELSARVAYLAASPAFPRVSVWKLLGLSSPWVLLDAERKSLKRVGAWRVVKSLPRRIRARVGSGDLPEVDARALALGATLMSDASVLVLDQPLAGDEAEARRRRAREILRRAEGRTLVMSMSRPVKLGSFDRIVELDENGIAYDGPPETFERQGATCRL